jgi:D-arabinose 1-dehydrogenase-like Zn-dependent alcohol dehydrogenase
MINKRLNVRGWPGGSAKDSEEAAEFAKLSGVRTRVERYPLEKANEAYDRMTSGKASFRVVIVPH